MSEPAVIPPEVAAQFTRWITELQVDVAETVGGVLLRGARVVPVGISQGATSRPTTAAGSLVGFALRNRSEEADVSVTVYLHDGWDDTGDVVLAVSLAPGESVRDWFGPGGLNIAYGLFVHADGPVDGSVFLRGVQ
ncbi:hypothetical protein QE364_003903 [Nocardioides zeae]|uniref:Uncharacterized protein n=1 Tax=Nocardioides zeae TaxID=1457234 RepID=A0ACC6IND6_9ACTN|nr:hypothetical protein [Nocardioides zeae]MDR6212172.1 hypothetical protein [Nocardioides zeae]